MRFNFRYRNGMFSLFTSAYFTSTEAQAAFALLSVTATINDLKDPGVLK